MTPKHGEMTHYGDEFNKDPMYFCEKCATSHITSFAGCNGLRETKNVTAPTALDVQVAGNHYKDLPIQPVEYIHANDIPYLEGNVIKYVSRWRTKGGVPDLEKARHYIDLLIELETRKKKSEG